MSKERIAEVGYINDECKHALISIYHPALVNPGPFMEPYNYTSVQVAISIEGAITLRANLNAFLEMHGVKEN